MVAGIAMEVGLNILNIDLYSNLEVTLVAAYKFAINSSSQLINTVKYHFQSELFKVERQNNCYCSDYYFSIDFIANQDFSNNFEMSRTYVNFKWPVS